MELLSLIIWELYNERTNVAPISQACSSAMLLFRLLIVGN
jgi:hypothetical protein